MNNNDLENIFPASVVKVKDSFSVVINRGANHGIKKGQRLLVYSIDSEELFDPETGGSLGHLEVVKGAGKVTHVQDKMATLESDRVRIERSITRRTSKGGLLGFPFDQPKEETEEKPVEIAIPFEKPAINDKVKPI
jgi:hypothetical protein